MRTNSGKNSLKFKGVPLWNKMPEVESRTQGSRPRPKTQKNFEAKAKDRPSRGQGQGQGHRCKCSPKKIFFKNFFQVISKKGLQKFFQAKKVFKKFFLGDLYLRKPKKRSLQIFRKVSGVFQRNFNGSKTSAVLEPRTGQFSRTWGFEAKDVLEDSTSAKMPSKLKSFSFFRFKKEYKKLLCEQYK